MKLGILYLSVGILLPLATIILLTLGLLTINAAMVWKAIIGGLVSLWLLRQGTVRVRQARMANEEV
jgi:uncharacterized membrane protein (DUF441 family)